VTPTHLLDANVLVALATPDHVHHDAAHVWFAGCDRFATCSLTQLALVRLLMRVGVPTAAAVAALDTIGRHDRHHFWGDDVEVDTTSMRTVIGHRQVTDAHLVALASRHRGRLATFDRGLDAAHRGATVLVPTKSAQRE